MTLLDVIGNKFYLAEGTMEMLMIYFVDHTVHPRTIILLPVLTLLQIAHECPVGLIEV